LTAAADFPEPVWSAGFSAAQFPCLLLTRGLSGFSAADPCDSYQSLHPDQAASGKGGQEFRQCPATPHIGLLSYAVAISVWRVAM
jgi:hypothetical protein